jgi:outer membrane lipoprotein-sorting protein
MKKNLVFFAFLVISVAFTTKAQTLDEVLNNYFKAVGQEKLITVQTLVTKGKMIQGGAGISITVYNKRPDMLRVEGNFQGTTFVQTYNGKEGWSMNQFAGETSPRQATQEELKSFKDQADIDGIMYNYKEKGFKAELLPADTVEGHKTYPVQITKPNGNVYINYIDADNFVILKTKARVKVEGVEREVENFFSNYKSVDGVLFPYAIDTKMNGQSVMQMVISNVKLNTELSDKFFTLKSE